MTNYLGVTSRAGLWPGRCALVGMVLLALSGMSRAATFTVTNTGDNSGVNPKVGAGTGTLRQAIVDADDAGGSDTIAFDKASFAATIAHTITLTAELPALSSDITLLGPGSSVLTVARSTAKNTPQFRIFTVSNGNSPGPKASISGLTIAHGDVYVNDSGPGGGLYNDHGTVSVSNCIFASNSAYQGGGIYNDGTNQGHATLNVSNCTFNNNIAPYNGGGLDNAGTPDGPYSNFGIATATVNNCVFTNNSAMGSGPALGNGGGIANDAGYAGDSSATQISATISVGHCAFTGNSAIYGGGLTNYSSSGKAEVSNCAFTSNSADFGGGGGIAAESNNTTVSNCSFTRNTTVASGGGLYGGGTVIDCVFTLNSAGDGGALYGGNLSVSRCSFIQNSASGNGGGFYAIGVALVSNCAFTRNTASNGGGLYDGEASDPITTVNNCVFTANSALSGKGGGLANIGGFDSTYFHNSNATISGCAFITNSATSGGAIYNGGEGGSANLKLSNCTLAYNTATYGGGLCNAGTAIERDQQLSSNNATAIVSNCTVTGNVAANGKGGGFYNEGSKNCATLTLDNTILVNPKGGNLAVANDPITSHGYNLSSDAAGGRGGYGPGGFLNGPGDIRNTNPRLDPNGLRNNGGPTPTIALQSGSPAINRGNPNFKSPPGPATDQRGPGFARVFGGRLDIGAFEVQPLSDVGISSTTPAGPVAPGAQLVYTLTATNRGPSAAPNATVTDTLPAHTTFVSLTQNSGPAFTFTKPVVGGTGTITGKLAALESGAQATFTLVLRVSPTTPDATTITNTAILTTTTTEITLTNNTAKTTVVIQAATAVGLSSAVANIATGSVTLKFTGALAPDAASDAAHYMVAVNVYPVTVLSAGYDANQHSVALDLAAGTLRSGDKVTVRWSGLTDAAGRALTGQTETLVVK